MSSKTYAKFKWPLNMYVMPKMNSPLHSGPCTRSRPNSKTPPVIIRIRKAASKAYVLLIVFNESSLVEGKKIIFASWITIVIWLRPDSSCIEIWNLSLTYLVCHDSNYYETLFHYSICKHVNLASAHWASTIELRK